MKITRRHAGRGAEILVGALYLTAAVLKAQNINRFIGQILAYQIFTSPSALGIVAVVTLALETFLGLSMVIGSPWRKGVLALGGAMLLFFTGLIVYAWQAHGLKDCGCFGGIPFTPPQAIAKNLVMLAVTAFAWFALVHPRGEAIEMRLKAARMSLPVVLAGLLCTAVAPQMGGDNASVVKTGGDTEIQSPEQAQSPFAKYSITTPYGETYNLGQGEYLVVMLSMTCEHCMESVPLLNAFLSESALPPLVALCLEPEEGDMADFQAFAGPMFPMQSIGNNMLEWSRICEGLPPRLCIVRDGLVEASWNLDVPDYQTVLDALSGVPAEKSE